jgi:hypothetical protein
MASPTPANSDTTRPRLAINRQATQPVARRSENCSRINETSPLPVVAPRRAAISWTTTSATVTRTMTNRVRYANSAPADA